MNNQAKKKSLNQLILASLHHWSLQNRHNGHIYRVSIGADMDAKPVPHTVGLHLLKAF